MKPQALLSSMVLIGLLALAGCKAPSGDVLNQKSVAELNMKAQSLMQAGDTTGAIARLESAHDLAPNEVTTMYNLAIAYQTNSNFDKALDYLLQLQDKPGIDAAELQKSLGITYEALGDQLEAEAAATEDAEGRKTDPAVAAEKRRKAEESYQLAIQAYQQAIASGIKNPDALTKQVEALEARRESKPGSAP